MEIIKFKISRRDFTDSEHIYVKVKMTQTIENLGLLTDIYADNHDISDLYSSPNKIIGVTDSKLNQVKSYDKDEPYKVGFDISSKSYEDYKGDWINGVDRVTNIEGETITYVIGTQKGLGIGTENQSGGMLYREVIGTKNSTTKMYTSEGWNKTNTSSGPQMQEEYLINVISPPEVESDVFIDRTTFSVLDNHLRLSEVNNLDQLTRYGNGYYNIKKG